MNRFQEKLEAHAVSLRRTGLETLQVNLGRKCNQACRHCHVDAAPWRTETLDAPTASRIAAWIDTYRPAVVDLTGGAPELCDQFPALVRASRAAGCRVIDRCNLTIITEPGFEWLPDFLAQERVEVIASLPCYSPANVNAQRGNGVFDKSIAGLRQLNALGYGEDLELHLVYNPLGPILPPAQAELEAEYKEALCRDYGIVFNKLFTITNQPIARFAEDLRRRGEWDDYLELLANAFNPQTVEGLMCRSTLSVGYQGEVFDCDFNQMLGMQLRNSQPLYLWDVTPNSIEELAINTGNHCLACTAGAGSSCTGALQRSGTIRYGTHEDGAA